MTPRIVRPSVAAPALTSPRHLAAAALVATLATTAAAGGQVWEVGNYVIGGSASGSELGRSLATGDFDGDGLDELAVGCQESGALLGHDSWLAIDTVRRGSALENLALLTP